MALLDSFFSNQFTEPFSSSIGQQDGYMGSNLDLLLQQARRNKSIRENRIFDYIQVENDPNFSRNAEANSKILEKYTSDLSITTQIVTVVNSTLSIAGVQEFIPSNIRTLLLNFNALADTNINAMQNIKQLVSFRQIEKAFLSDLTLQFGNNTITFDQIALMADNVINNVQQYDSVENTGIRPLLSIGIQQFLPKDIAAIFDDLEYLDMLANIFGDQSPNIALVNSLFVDATETYSQKRIEDMVTTERYADITLTLADPLGTNLQDQFKIEIQNDYADAITAMAEAAPQFTNDEDRATVIAFLIDDAVNNVDVAFSGTVGLPSLPAVASAVIADSHNQALEAINNAFEKFTETLLSDIGIEKPATGTRAIDHLQNVKRNLKKRLEMRRTGDTSDNFTEIENYLRSVLKNKDLSEPRLNALNAYIDTLLKEKVEVC